LRDEKQRGYAQEVNKHLEDQKRIERQVARIVDRVRIAHLDESSGTAL
jgi:hypothetical protein